MNRVKIVSLAILVLTLIALGHHQLERVSNASLIPAALRLIVSRRFGELRT
jgi:hypothetical protein